MFWHIDGQHDVFRTQGYTIPATFDAFLNYNQPVPGQAGPPFCVCESNAHGEDHAITFAEQIRSMAKLYEGNNIISMANVYKLPKIACSL